MKYSRKGQEMNLKEISTETLWKSLEDISKLEVMQERPDNDYFLVWYRISKAILHEIDQRMKADHDM